MTEFDEATVERAAKGMADVCLRGGWKSTNVHERAAYRRYARAALEAAQEPKPEWPSREARNAFYEGYRESHAPQTPPIFNPEAIADGLRAAFLADPILREVIAFAHDARCPVSIAALVRGAGLLDGTEGK